MAQTRKRRRPTKHRGTPAGTIETRGRTGRKPTPAEKRPDGKETAAQRRQARLDKPPTWRGSLNRSLVATAIFIVAAIFVLHVKPAGAIGLCGFVLIIYTLFGYATDMFVYRRRQRQKTQR